MLARGASARRPRPPARFIFPGLLLLFWSTVCYSVAGVHLESRDGLPDEIVAAVSGVFFSSEIFFPRRGGICGGAGDYIVCVLSVVSTHGALHLGVAGARLPPGEGSIIHFISCI